MACAKYLLHSLTTSCNIFPSENPNVFLSQELLQILFSFLLKTILTFMLKKSVYAKKKLSCLHILLISIITWPCGISVSSIYSISMLDLFQHCHPCFSLSFYNIHLGSMGFSLNRIPIVWSLNVYSQSNSLISLMKFQVKSINF